MIVRLYSTWHSRFIKIKTIFPIIHTTLCAVKQSSSLPDKVVLVSINNVGKAKCSLSAIKSLNLNILLEAEILKKKKEIDIFTL